MAIAAKYCRNITGERVLKDAGWRITVENINEPAGETQTFEPRPLPATWVVVVAVNPVGRCRRSLVFLASLSTQYMVILRTEILF